MIQVVRLILILLRVRRRSGTAVRSVNTPFRVRWLDCDTYLHMNNARYLSIMDLARLDLMIRSGWLKQFRHYKLKPIVVDAQIRYRRELKPGKRFYVESTIDETEGRKVWVVQKFLSGDTVHAEARVGLLFLSASGVAASADVKLLMETTIARLSKDSKGGQSDDQLNSAAASSGVSAQKRIFPSQQVGGSCTSSFPDRHMAVANPDRRMAVAKPQGSYLDAS